MSDKPQNDTGQRLQTLSAIFARDLSGIDMVQEREAQAVQMVVDYLKTRG